MRDQPDPAVHGSSVAVGIHADVVAASTFAQPPARPQPGRGLGLATRVRSIQALPGWRLRTRCPSTGHGESVDRDCGGRPARLPGRPPSPVRAGQGQRDRFGGLPRSWRIYWCLPNSSATQMRPSGPRTHAMPIVSKSPSTFSRWCGEAIQMSWAPNGLSSGPPTRMFSARYA